MSKQELRSMPSNLSTKPFKEQMFQQLDPPTYRDHLTPVSPAVPSLTPNPSLPSVLSAPSTSTKAALRIIRRFAPQELPMIKRGSCHHQFFLLYQPVSVLVPGPMKLLVLTQVFLELLNLLLLAQAVAPHSQPHQQPP